MSAFLKYWQALTVVVLMTAIHVRGGVMVPNPRIYDVVNKGASNADLGNMKMFDRNSLTSRQFPYPSSGLNLVDLGGRKYFFVDEQVTWFEAASFCPLVGMDLATIDTDNEHFLFSGYLDSIGWYNTKVLWVGGHSLSSTEWAWLSGAPMNYAGGWDSGYPTVSTNCMGYWSSAWRNYPCLQTQWGNPAYAVSAFVCEERS